MIALPTFLPEVITSFVPKSICITDINIIRAAKFVEDNQKSLFVRIFAFNLDSYKKSSIQEQYLDFIKDFLKQNAKKLLLHHNIDLIIKLEPETLSIFGSIYNILELNLKSLYHT